MSLDVICAGFGRTGTLSLMAAWHRLAEGEPMDWAWLLEGFRAASDFPLCWHYRELMEVFPRAHTWHSIRHGRTSCAPMTATPA